MPRLGGRKANCREKSDLDNVIWSRVQRSQGKESGKTSGDREFKILTCSRNYKDQRMLDVFFVFKKRMRAVMAVLPVISALGGLVGG